MPTPPSDLLNLGPKPELPGANFTDLELAQFINSENVTLNQCYINHDYLVKWILTTKETIDNQNNKPNK